MEVEILMNWIFSSLIGLSFLCSLVNGSGAALGRALLEGTEAGLQLGLSLAGPLCLWSGIRSVFDRIGFADYLAKYTTPFLSRIFPAMVSDPELRRDLSANFCANLLGLGNAATPRGIRAARRLSRGDRATDQLCRLVVLNTASIQLIPTSVAALRSSLGSAAPFDILPGVWLTSCLSAGLGLAAAWSFGKLWPHG